MWVCTAYFIPLYIANSLRLNRAESKAHEQYRRLAGEVEARREAYIEEVVCDEVGVLARDHKAFDRFLRSEHVRNDGKFLRWLRKVWQSIKSAFSHDVRTFNEVMRTLDELINVSTAKVAKGTQASNEEKYALTDTQVTSIIEAMKANAEVAPQLELTPENWAAEFGAEGVVQTPIGEVKMSANQYQKMEQPDRRTKLGMVKPTLKNPDVIIEEVSKPKDGRVPERNSSYIFIKAFTNADGSRDYMFTSVSNLRDGIEIVMSNQEKETPRIKRLLKEGKLAYINKATLPSEFTASAQGDQSTIPSEVSYSDNKDTTSLPNDKISEAKLSLRSLDATYLDAVERGDMATAQRMVMEAAKLAMPNTKVVDEDGNPKVVYHQTNATVYINRETGQNWDELDWRERMEWDERDDWDDYWEEQEFNTFSRVNARTTNEFDGFFFAPVYDEYHEYGDRTIEAFLNIENPASREDYYIDSSKNNAGRDERIRLQNEGYDGVIREEDGTIWEYVAFNPNQIKSADTVTYDDAGNVIPLSERFNPRKEDIRYSLIGEMGASNIESYGRYGSPAYALEQARDMEADGKSVKEIRVATNWERGKDGKWRYEINDGVYIDPEDKDKEYKLSDILKNDALYEAYSELADMPVYYAELEGNSRGMYDGEAIWLSNTLDEQQAHSTLVHEVQHAIQHREGFARGGNKGMFEQEAIEKLEQTLGDLEKEKDKFKSYNKLRKAYLILKYVANSLRLDRAESKAYEQYRRLAGEVEARNVQARMNMSEEERLLIPIGSTEDVARSSQNVIQRELMEADGTRYSLREESAPTRYSLQSGDMPFFNDNGDIITFDNTDITGEDYDAVELRSPMPTTPRTTEDVIKAHLSARHNAAEELFANQNISVPLRDSYVEIIVNELQNEYRSRKEGEDSTGANSAKREVAKVSNNRLWRKRFNGSAYTGVERRGRDGVLTPTRYSLQSGDIPFFNDNGDIITFDNTDLLGNDAISMLLHYHP